MSAETVDYAATRIALRNREAKASALARAAWDQGLASTDIPELDPASQRKLARIAGVNASKPGSPTWASVVALLVRMEKYAESHPDHQSVVREAPTGRAVLLPVVFPKGWAELVALGPVEGMVCQIGECKRPGVIRTLMNAAPHAWRCAVHPPVDTDWGVSLNWAPTHCNQPIRCYCGRCEPPAVS